MSQSLFSNTLSRVQSLKDIGEMKRAKKKKKEWSNAIVEERIKLEIYGKGYRGFCCQQFLISQSVQQKINNKEKAFIISSVAGTRGHQIT